MKPLQPIWAVKVYTYTLRTLFLVVSWQFQISCTIVHQLPRYDAVTKVMGGEKRGWVSEEMVA